MPMQSGRAEGWPALSVPAVTLTDMERKKRLGSVIRRARVNARLGVQELATLVGVGRDTINNWEAGRAVPSMLYLGPLCVSLRVDPRVFVELPEPPRTRDPIEDFMLDVGQATDRGQRQGMDDERRRRGLPPADEGSAE